MTLPFTLPETDMVPSALHEQRLMNGTANQCLPGIDFTELHGAAYSSIYKGSPARFGGIGS